MSTAVHVVMCWGRGGSSWFWATIPKLSCVAWFWGLLFKVMAGKALGGCWGEVGEVQL